MLGKRLKEWHKDANWASEHHVLHDNSETLVNAIWQGKANMVMDGSYKDGISTAAFIVKGDNSFNWLITGNQALRYPVDQSSLRSEFAGCYGIVRTIQAICKEHCTMHGLVELGCDNIETLHWKVDF